MSEGIGETLGDGGRLADRGFLKALTHAGAELS
jgi:hypothetical protein